MKFLLKFLKNWSLPLSMLLGGIFFRFFDRLSVTIPYLIFVMLLLTFAKLTPRKVRFSPLHGWLILIQIAGSLTAYLLLRNADEILAESALICILAPTATSAAVVTGMLGGSIACLTTYTLIGNLVVAVAGPLIFSLIGPQSELQFTDAFLQILAKVAPMLISPLLVAWIAQRYSKPVHNTLLKLNKLPFYIWTFALMIVTGKTVCFLIDQENPNLTRELLIAGTALVICIAQFLGGKKIGGFYRKRISGGQALGQKNTVLAIWMAQTFLIPVASLGPAAYVLWQNIFNSWQLYRRRNGKTV